ncbi:MAG: hypothetical protein K2H46_03950 [Muribaculaceae bacterium]|nr:hypothetical protein [Muribaculaceae bacterium]
MEQQISTTPEQSKRIIACGVDPKSADFVWMEDKPNPRLALRTEIIEDSNPYIVGYGWSLGRLLTLLPPIITGSPYEDDDPDGGYDKYVYGLIIYPGPVKWHGLYAPMDEEDGLYKLYESEDASVIEAVVRMIETLVSHKRKLNEIEQ